MNTFLGGLYLSFAVLCVFVYFLIWISNLDSAGLGLGVVSLCHFLDVDNRCIFSTEDFELLLQNSVNPHNAADIYIIIDTI